MTKNWSRDALSLQQFQCLRTVREWIGLTILCWLFFGRTAAGRFAGSANVRTGWKTDIRGLIAVAVVEASPFSREPYRRRTWLRQRLPFPLLNLAPKGVDCEAAGGEHEWYNQDGSTSSCYHCKVAREGQLWRRA